MEGIEPIEEALAEKEGKSGLGSMLAGVRLLFGNPVVRALLRGAAREAECKYGDREVKASLVYHALSQLAGETVSCPLGARFASLLMRLTVRAGVWLLRGDWDHARKALQDPAVRRGIALVFRGLAMYGVTVPQKLPAPFLIVWNFTNMCNLRCIHCYQRADKPTPDELSLEEKLHVVDELDRAGVAAVALSGGEPTIHPHFLRIVEELSSRGIYVAVATNGTRFAKKEFLEKAVKAGVRYVEVSVDSAKPKKHDRFRGVPGAWEKAVQALRNAVELGVSNGMAVTITKVNIDEVEDILDLAEEIGVQRVIFFNFVPVGRGEENAYIDLTPEEREELLRTLYKENKRRPFEILSTAPQYARVALQLSGGQEVAPTHFYMGNDRIVRALAEFIGGCGAGRIYAAIQPNGDMTPCVFLPIKVGSLREKSFTEIWTQNPLLQQLRDRDKLHGFCGKCPYRYVCGGCRARAYAYTGDPLGPDPGCILNKKVWDEIASKHRVRLIKKWTPPGEA
ncbi:MAG: radical SAM protein [Desulfurococcales archaeon]|nr:radical SAM protein [Desulfurococcales archaeon]